MEDYNVISTEASIWLKIPARENCYGADQNFSLEAMSQCQDQDGQKYMIVIYVIGRIFDDFASKKERLNFSQASVS